MGKHWTCPVCNREWGIYLLACARCGCVRGKEFIEFGPVYIAEVGTPVLIDGSTDHAYKSVIVSHCAIKSVLHYIVWYPGKSGGHSYRIVSGGQLTKL